MGTKSYWDYPYTIHTNVLLLDGMIINWKTGRMHWETVSDSMIHRQPHGIIMNNQDKELEVDSMSFVCNNSKENEIIFEHKSKEFYKMYELHPDCGFLCNPY